MARRSSLPSPRVPQAELQRWIDAISVRLRNIESTMGGVTQVVQRFGGSGAPTPTPTPGDEIPILATPPTPVNVEVACGIGVCMVTWANPFRMYRNHARALVFRNTVDAFDTAAEIGQASWLLYVDDTVEDETDYWYWVVFESTASVRGLPSASAMGQSAADPEAVYQEFLTDLRASPLAAALSSDIGLPAVVTEEIRRIALITALLSAGAADDAADTAETANTLAGTASAAASAAQALVDQARADLVALTGRVDTAETTIGVHTAEIADRATTAVVAALTGRVTVNEDAVSANATSITSLMTDLADRATIAALNVLGGRVTANEGGIAANLASITALTAEVAGKAAADALVALTTRVTDNETGIAANAAEITALEAAHGGRTLGPEQNVFGDDTTADKAAAEALRDAYQATNPMVTWNGVEDEWLDHYDGDNDINIELRWGQLYIYQRRLNGAWVDNGEALARAAAVTGLNTSVMQQGALIAANTESITALTAEVAGKASIAALAALMGTVTDQDGRITANAAAITDLTAGISGLATAAALQALTTRVTSAEGTIGSQGQSIAQLQADLAGKASTMALDALTARVTENEDGIAAIAQRVTTLEASTGEALGPTPNTFTGADRAAAEAARDMQAMDDAAWLALYDANPDNAIELTWQ